MTTISWIHISDFHFNYTEDENKRKLQIKEWLNHITRQLNRLNISPNFLIITGDVADEGRKRDYDFAIKLLEKDKLLKLLKDSNEYFILNVPGNHDVKFEKNKNKAINDLVNRNSNDITNILKPEMKKNVSYKNFNRFNYYREFQLNFNKCSEYSAYTKKFSLENLKISFIGLNTAWLYTKENKRNMTFGENFLNQELTKINEEDLVIFLMHHPPNYLCQNDRDIVDERISAYDFILCGHKHKTATKTYGCDGDSLLCIYAGKFDNPDVGGEYKSYNIVNFSKNNNSLWEGKIYKFWHDKKWNIYSDGDEDHRKIIKHKEKTQLHTDLFRLYLEKKLKDDPDLNNLINLFRSKGRKDIKELLSSKQVSKLFYRERES